MAQDIDVAMARGTGGAESVESMLGVGGIAADGLSDLLVDDDIDLHPSLGPPLQDLIEPPFLVEVGWPAEEELGTQPPVLDVDGLLCLFEGDGDGVEVVLAVDIPLDLVAVSLGGEGVEAVAVGDLGAFVVGGLLMLLVVAMVGIDEIAKLADLVLEMDCTDFGIVEVGG